MSSIITNTSAMTALSSLTQTNKQLEITQSRISTGYKVATASDNAAYWSIATTMRSDNKALSTVQDALGLGAAMVDVAYTGLTKSVDVLDEIKTKLVAARQPGVDRTKIQSEVSALQDQLQSIADSAVFSGESWLKIDTTGTPASIDKSVVSSFSRAGGVVSIGTISINLYTAGTAAVAAVPGVDANSDGDFTDPGDTAPVAAVPAGAATTVALFDANATAASKAGLLDAQHTVTSSATFTIATLDISGLTDSTADITDLEDMIKAVDGAVQSITGAASSLGAVKTRVGLQQDFVSSMMDAIDRGVGQLVDADMTAESTRLQALQVQQQLGIQALSIANSNSQNILALFRG
jgi:flagellin